MKTDHEMCADMDATTEGLLAAIDNHCTSIDQYLQSTTGRWSPDHLNYMAKLRKQLVDTRLAVQRGGQDE